MVQCMSVEANTRMRVPMAAKANDVAIFRSGHEAMRFAYNYNAQQYPMTIMGKMMRGGPVGSGRGLHGLDGAAIAGSVKRVIEALPHDLRQSMVARHTADSREYSVAVSALIRPAMASLGTGVHHTRMVFALICRYYGRPAVKLADLCDEYAMDAATMTRRWQRVRERMRAIESAAETAADGALVEAGLVE